MQEHCSISAIRVVALGVSVIHRVRVVTSAMDTCPGMRAAECLLHPGHGGYALCVRGNGALTGQTQVVSGHMKERTSRGTEHQPMWGGVVLGTQTSCALLCNKLPQHLA